MNISSAIVHARPGTAEQVQARLAAVAGVEVHAVSDAGKMIVTLESVDDAGTVATFETISALADVLSAAMVYHQVEPNPEVPIPVQACPPGCRNDKEI